MYADADQFLRLYLAQTDADVQSIPIAPPWKTADDEFAQLRRGAG
jgi:hypothetical protein